MFMQNFWKLSNWKLYAEQWIANCNYPLLLVKLTIYFLKIPEWIRFFQNILSSKMQLLPFPVCLCINFLTSFFNNRSETFWYHYPLEKYVTNLWFCSEIGFWSKLIFQGAFFQLTLFLIQEIFILYFVGHCHGSPLTNQINIRLMIIWSENPFKKLKFSGFANAKYFRIMDNRQLSYTSAEEIEK